MPLRCYVQGCKRNNKDDKEHSFFQRPKNPEIRQQWLEFAEMTGHPVHMRICSDDFEQKYVRKRYPRPLLTPEAIPTLRKPVLAAKPIEKYHGSKMELQLASLQADCSHKVTGIDATIDKPAADQQALVHIETNYPVRVKLSG